MTQHKIVAFLCVGSEEAQSIFQENLMKLMDLGFVALSIDHRVGGFTPVCYSEKHDHPPGYWPWMYKSMLEFLRKARKAYRGRNPETTFSFESPCEIWIQEIDLHLHRPYGIRPFGVFTVPFFDYVYRDYAFTYGGDFMLDLAHPEVELIKHAKVLTLGMQNLVNIQQYEWDYEIDPNYPALTLMYNIVKAQRTYAHDYLVLGQMLRPTELEVEKVMVDIYAPSSLGDSPPDLGQLAVPTVMHGVWKSPAGKIGYILTNWTGELRKIKMDLVECGGHVSLVTEDKRKAIAEDEANSGKVQVTLEPRSVAPIEQELA